METKLCHKCQTEKPLSAFYLHKTRGRRSPCIECRRAHGRAYNQTPTRKLYNKEHQQKLKDKGYFEAYYKQAHVKQRRATYMRDYTKLPHRKIKEMARWLINRAKQAGRITQQPCAECGTQQTEGHHLDYNKPLLVVWLCRDCHRAEHAKAKPQS